MRLFLAIGLSNNIKDYLYGLQKKIGSEYAKIKFVDKKNLHLTLKFLGEVPNDKVENVRNKFKNIKFNEFDVRLTKLGVFPNEAKINVLWVGVEPQINIMELQKLIDSETLDFGNIRLGAHMTLGRVKSIKHKEKFREKLFNIKVENLRFKIDAFLLCRSDLSKDGPTYNVLEEYKLNP